MKTNGWVKLLAMVLVLCLLAGCGPAQTETTTTTAATTTTVTTVAPTTTTVPTTTTTVLTTKATTTKAPVPRTVDLMKNVKAVAVQEKAADDAFVKAQWDFALKLVKQANKQDDDNVLVSPLSAQMALAMLANGASGNTKTQIEAVLGMKLDDYNRYAAAYLKTLTDSESCKLAVANSLWVKRGLSVKKNFLQANANYYGADVFQAPFDKKTLQDMNSWVDEKTDGLIKEFANELDTMVEMVLFNTVAFDARWMYPFNEEDTAQGIFIAADGEKQAVDFMTSKTEQHYIKDDKAQGFIKGFYGQYSMVLLLPNEGITPEQYLGGLTPDSVKAVLNSKSDDIVIASRAWTMLLPKFRFEYETDLKEALQQLGVQDLFTEGKADLSGINKDLFVRDADQKSVISVNERGATVATVSRYRMLCSATSNYLAFDRPFVYMIIDDKQMPIFVGTVTEIK